MADNYLERRMEDLRSGRLNPSAVRSVPIRKDMLSYPFRPRRVLIISDRSEVKIELAKTFRRLDCKVALAERNAELGKELAYKLGIRYLVPGDLEIILSDLINAWRDLDIVICDDKYSAPIQIYIEQQRKKFSLPGSYIPRLIILSDVEDAMDSTPLCGREIVTVRVVLPKESADSSSEAKGKSPINRALNLIPFICLEGNEYLDRMIFSLVITAI